MGISFGAGGVLEAVSALGGTDILEAVEQESPDTDTKTKEGMRVRVERRADIAGVVAWKTSHSTSTIDLLALKAAKVSFMLSLDRVKFLGSQIVFIGTSEAKKKRSVQLDLELTREVIA